jgi:Ca2+-binding RTX toxin-like protein
VVAWLDDKANDGSFGENDYIHADVEGIRGSNASQGDTLYGNDSANVLWGGAGNDQLRGLGGSDYLNGETGADDLRGGQGPDALWGGTEPGGSVNVDFADYQDHWNPVSVSLDGEKNDGEVGEADIVGTDVEGIIGGTGKDMLVGDARGNTLWGHDGDDTLIGNGGGYAPNQPGLFVPDTLAGNDGNDMIHGGPAGSAYDIVDGGVGLDTVTYEWRTDPLKISLVPGSNFGEDTIKNVENAKGGTNDDVLIGDDAANWLAGNGGNDSISGNGGNDVLHGFAGNDWIEGGEGNDVVGGGDDADYLSGGPGGDHIRGHAGFDTVTYAGYVKSVTVTLDDDVYNDGAAGEGDKVLNDVENVVGGEVDDVIYGSSFTNILWGGEGNDKLFGLGGADLLDGKAGFDQVDGGDSTDTCFGEQRTACEN